MKAVIRLIKTGVAIFAFMGTVQAQQKQILSVLSPQGVLDFDVVESFEKANKGVSVRVELVSGSSDYEQRIRSAGMGAWDVVVAEENRLVTLGFARLIRPVVLSGISFEESSNLSKRSAYNADGHVYFPLMVDPLGVVWKKETKAASGPLEWSWLVDVNLNPLWRGRVFFPPSLRFLTRIALLANDIGSVTAPPEQLAKAVDWIRRAYVQSRKEKVNSVNDLFSENTSAGVMWMSDYLRLRRLLPALRFGIPQKASFFERFGTALVADTVREALATKFVEHLVRNREQLAHAFGLVPIEAKQWDEQSVAGWRLYEDNEPTSKYLDTELARLSVK